MTARHHTEIIELKPSEMTVNLSYQRDPHKRMRVLQKIAQEWDPRRAFPLHVWKNGEWEVIDGAGRRCIMTEILKIDNPVQCVNHRHIKTVEEAADWFLKLNPDTVKKVTPTQKFKARIAAHDEEAIRINNAANTGRLVIGGGGVHGISVQAAEVLDRLGVLSKVGAVKHAAWPTQKPVAWVYIAIGAIIRAERHIDFQRLVDTLTRTPPTILESMLKATGMGMPHSRYMPPKMAELIVNEYNKHLGKKRKLDPDWSEVDKLLEDRPFCDRWQWIIKNRRR